MTPEIAIRYVAAFAESLPAGPIVVTRDGRHTGPMLAEAVRAALLASGRSSLDAGIAATPTTGVLVRHQGAAGGIQISASHNPSEYNGLKLLDRTGRVIPAEAGQQVIDRYRGEPPPWKPFDQLGASRTIEDSTTAHLAMVAGICDVERIRGKRFRVFLDANNGSGSVLGIALLEELGCEVTVLGADADGQFGHPPEPTSENLKSVLQLVKASGANIGFCQDPDADRLAVVDETGRYVGEEYTLAMCVDHVLRHGSLGQGPGAVVTNCSTSRMTQDLAEKYSVPFHRSKVGEANVVDQMLAEGAAFGGEGNGGVIDPHVGYVRDSFVSMAYVLDALAARGGTLAAWADSLPKYFIIKRKLTCPRERVEAACAALRAAYAEAVPSEGDGLRLDFDDRWVQVRASNTEPIIRIIAETPQLESAKKLCDDAVKIVKRAVE